MTEAIYHLVAQVDQDKTSLRPYSTSVHTFSLVAESEEDAHHRAFEQLANEGPTITIISCKKKQS